MHGMCSWDRTRAGSASAMSSDEDDVRPCQSCGDIWRRMKKICEQPMKKAGAVDHQIFAHKVERVGVEPTWSHRWRVVR